MSENLIKVLLKTACPHCQKEILVEVENSAPVIGSVITPEDIIATKEYTIKSIRDLFKNEQISKGDMDSAIEWINNEETVFGPKDAQSVIDSVKNAK